MPEPRRPLPLFDATAPIVCTIGATEIPGRIEVLERMRHALTSIEATPTGLLLRFPDDPAVRADVERFALDEKRCCQFWGFEVTGGADGTTLRWVAPPDARDLLARIETVFRSDTPISTLDGLL